MKRPFPVAASSAVELALVGPTRPASVVAVTTHATYLQVADAEQTLVCLASAEAVQVPCAVLLDRTPPPQLAVGTPATVGCGYVNIDDLSFRVNRWWRPPQPRGLGRVPPGRLAAAVRWLVGRVADPLDVAGRAAVADLVDALATGQAPDDPVARLLGRGPGLTPTGDDVLAGALVTLRALGAPTAAPLAAAVQAFAPGSTTIVSTGLLRHAAEGRCIPQLADLLAAVGAHPGGTGTASQPERAGLPLPTAAGALLAVGHCSGAGLLHGVLVAVASAHALIAQGVVRARPELDLPAVLPSPVPA
jgi:hypothetical protein